MNKKQLSDATIVQNPKMWYRNAPLYSSSRGDLRVYLWGASLLVSSLMVLIPESHEW